MRHGQDAIAKHRLCNARTTMIEQDDAGQQTYTCQKKKEWEDAMTSTRGYIISIRTNVFPYPMLTYLLHVRFANVNSSVSLAVRYTYSKHCMT